MIDFQTDPLETAGGVFMMAVGLGCAWLGGLAVLRPDRPPQPIQGPVRVVRAWGLGYVLLGICMAVRMTSMLVGEEPAWPLAVIYWVAGPLLTCSVTAAGVSQRRARRRAGGVRVGRHKRSDPSPGPGQHS
ncbi:hypothetical protein ACF061_24345 [Streptomyces sp. NPDC015220]|uniref:hypothetical protein n=1 Tax=Streptomyces sp. NPDC015220 TaxID=3364947 RepID=UPI0036F60E28